MSDPPSGNAADPTLYTTTFVLVDIDGLIHTTSTTPEFIGLTAGLYNLYVVNYINTESATVAPILAVNELWSAVVTFGNDDATNCFDYSDAFGTGCPIVVCDELQIGEDDVLANPASNFNIVDHSQMYCLVCDDKIIATNDNASFDLSVYPQASNGANCQLFAFNYNSNTGFPLTVNDEWRLERSTFCTDECFDFIGMNLDITATVAVNSAKLKGYPNSEDNYLTWNISNDESLVEKYIIERSEDGINYISIKEFTPLNNGKYSNDYNYTDKSVERKKLYYRVKIKNNNKKLSFSNTINISRDKIDFSVYPNPFKNIFNVEFYSEDVSEVEYEVTNVVGQVIEKRKQYTESGFNKISIDLENASSSFYFLSIKLAGNNFKYKVIKE